MTTELNNDLMEDVIPLDVEKKELTFVEVSDEFRTMPRTVLKPDPLMKALLEGKTLKAYNIDKSAAKYYRWAKASNHNLRIRRFDDFLILWLEDEDEPPTTKKKK